MVRDDIGVAGVMTKWETPDGQAEEKMEENETVRENQETETREGAT